MTRPIKLSDLEHSPFATVTDALQDQLDRLRLLAAWWDASCDLLSHEQDMLADALRAAGVLSTWKVTQ